MVEFRLAGVEAAADLARLWDIANAHRRGEPPPGEPSVEAVEKQARRLGYPGSVAVLAIDDLGGVIAGCCAMPSLDATGTPVDGVAHLSGVAVDPARWGDGLGSAVVRRAAAAARDLGYRRVRLHVLEDNGRARGVYERLGWSLIATGQPNLEGPEAVYELVIDEG